MLDKVLSQLKVRLYRKAVGKDAAEMAENLDPSSFPLSWGELLHFLHKKGALALVRGMLYKHRLRAHGRRFFLGKSTNILFPSYLSVGDSVAIGDYCFLNCYSREGVVLGDHVRLREYAWVQATGKITDPGVGVRVGSHTYIGPHCTLGAGGGITIGQHVQIGGYVDILAEDHQFDDPEMPIWQQGVTRRGIVIEDDCWIGNKVIVLDAVTIGRGSVVGAGSVVTKSIPPCSIAVGNPARVVRCRK